jgi:ABC-type Fe3+ transport system permease subunit
VMTASRPAKSNHAGRARFAVVVAGVVILAIICATTIALAYTPHSATGVAGMHVLLSNPLIISAVAAVIGIPSLRLLGSDGGQQDSQDPEIE